MTPCSPGPLERGPYGPDMRILRQPLSDVTVAWGLLFAIVHAHWAAGGWVADGGVGDDGAAAVAITLYFLLGGALFSALGRRPGAPALTGRCA